MNFIEMTFDGKWVVSFIDGLTDFDMVTPSQRQQLMDDLIDNKIKILTELRIDGDILNIIKHWA